MKNWFSFDCGINILTKENLTIYDNPVNTEHFYKITLPNCGKYMFIEAYFNSLDALEASIQKASLLFWSLSARHRRTPQPSLSQ